MAEQNYWDTVKLGKQTITTSKPKKRRGSYRSGQRRMYEREARKSGSTVHRRDLGDRHTFEALADHTEKGKKGKFVVDPAYIKLETRFIDEMYGTAELKDKKGNVITPETPGAIAEGKATSLWGLDLKRVLKNDDGTDINVGDANYYEAITRGEVDWAHYDKDPAYQKALNNYISEGNKDNIMQGKIDTPEEVRALHQFDKRTYEGVLDEARTGEKKKWEWDDWKVEYDVDQVKMEGSDLYIDGEKHIGMDERLKIPYELDGDGNLVGKEFAVGKNEDGTTKYKTIDSPYLNVGKAYDPESFKGEAHEWKGIEVEATQPERPDIDSRPSLGGYINWDSGSPKLTNPVKAAAPLKINPVSV